MDEAAQTPKTPQKRNPKPKRQTEKQPPPTPPSSRRTRSQVAPDWTTKESLILVNEITAVESDCLKALSSYQKWKIVVQNCSAMEVKRTLNQCRYKWNLLLTDYNLIKQWDSKSSPSYWLLDAPQRTGSGLPVQFDYDLFKAINDYVRAQKDLSDTDPDSDPEADAELLDGIAKLESKKHWRRSMSLKFQPEEKSEDYCTNGQPQVINFGEETQKSNEEEYPQIWCEREIPEVVYREEEPHESHVEEKSQEYCPVEIPEKIDNESQKSLGEEQPKSICTSERKMADSEENEQMLENKLQGNAESIFAECGGSASAPQESHVEEKSQEYCPVEIPDKIDVEGKSQKSLVEESPKRTEEKDQMMENKLQGNAESIFAECEGSASAPQEIHVEKKSQECCPVEIPDKIDVEGKSQKSLGEEKPKSIRARKRKTSGTEEKGQMMENKLQGNSESVYAERGASDSVPQKSLVEEKPKRIQKRKKKVTSVEEGMVDKLHGYAEMIHAILGGNLPESATGCGSSNSTSKDLKTDLIRQQGDKLIACFGDIVKILDQFPSLVHESV
ncbi:uncharacterized protein LOC126660560 [Mercurialis annua]|uniref:uncharacterized protein LOC126660560 n=1 Tax=Mercurialis annua TaxID=3986 RepID=UPI002160303D|nr:uncharacterized protein LOC126660560 [Mercurialis annua]